MLCLGHELWMLSAWRKTCQRQGIIADQLCGDGIRSYWTRRWLACPSSQLVEGLPSSSARVGEIDRFHGLHPPLFALLVQFAVKVGSCCISFIVSLCFSVR